MEAFVRVRCIRLVLISLMFLWASLTAGQDTNANPAAPAPETKAAILGTISDSKGQALAGAVVVADNGAGFSQNTTTDGQGQYAITELPAGAYSVSVQSGTNKVLEAAAVVSPGQAVTLDVKGLSPGAETGTVAIAGTVSDLSGNGVSGATIELDATDGSTKKLSSDPQGTFAAKNLPPGTYFVRTVVNGIRIFQARVALGPNQTVTLGVGGALAAQTTDLPVPPSAPAPAAVPASVQAAAAPPPSTSPAQASGQAPGGTGSLNGSVTDQTGAVIVGASIKVSTTGLNTTATSNQQGNYAVKNLPPGLYTVTVTAEGFKSFVADSVRVLAGVDLPLDAPLEPAGSTTEIKVEGQEVGQVETEKAEVSGTITQKEVVSLGLNGRNFTQLIALAPGVSNQTGQDEAKVGVSGSVKYSVNGGRVEYNTFEVDGSDVLNAGLNGSHSTLMVYPSLDAIQEVKVLTSNYGAMYGRTASGTVLVTTKSGGTQWHGSGYEFIRNEFFNARNYFDQTRKAPFYRRNDFGFTIGGPVSFSGYNPKKENTFVFWSEEFRIEKSPSDLEPDFNRGVPSLAERQGDFSDVCPTPEGGVVIFQRSQYPDCPSYSTVGLSFQGFPNNNLTGSGHALLDTNALALLSTNLIPLPNSNTGCNSSIGSCYDAVISVPTHWREELLRIDQNFTPKLRATFRYIHDSWDTVTPVPQWGYVQNSFPTVQNKFVGPGDSLVAGLTHTISNTLLNQLTASFVNSHITLNNMNGPGGAVYTRPSGVGAPGGDCSQFVTNQNEGNAGCLGAIFNNGFGGKAPGIVIGGNNQEYGGTGFAVDPAYMPWEHTNPTFSIRDDVSMVIRRKHNLQFGGQFVSAQRNENNNAVGATSGDLQGLLTFSNVNGGSFNTGNAFANFLALLTPNPVSFYNEVQSYTQDSAQLRYHNDYKLGEPYVQDDWKITSRLTLNLGIRFSLFGVFHERNHNAYNWDPAAYSPALAAQLSINSATGQLVNGPGGLGTPIPLSLSNLDPRITNGTVQCGVNVVADGCMKGHLFNPAPRVGFAWDPRGDGKTSIRGGYGIFYEHGTGQEANTGSLEGTAPLVLTVAQDFPGSYSCIGGGANCPSIGGALPGAFPISMTAIPTRAVWSYAQQWSLSVERQLPKGFVSTLAYVGSKGTHLTVERQLNQLKPLPSSENPFGPNQPLIAEQGITSAGSTIGDCGGFDSLGTPGFNLLNGTLVTPGSPAYINLTAACFGENLYPATPTPNVNTLRPYPGFAQIFTLQNIADSGYSAVQATVRKIQGPVTLGVAYSYSHSIDDSSDRSDATFVNSYDLRSNRASSNFDQRHLLNVSYVYTLPDFGRFLRGSLTDVADDPHSGAQKTSNVGSSGFFHWVGDGWQISGITTVQSGTPFSVINGGSSTISVLDNAGVANGVGAGSYPDVVRGEPFPTVGRYNSESFGPLLLNPNLFVAPRGLTFGNAGRNFLNNPRRTNFDISLLKHFNISESRVFEFRAEAFNIFNHTQFRIYNPDLGNTGSNTISCYGGPEYSAGYSPAGGGGCLVGSAFLRPVDAHRPRTIQFALKFNF